MQMVGCEGSIILELTTEQVVLSCFSLDNYFWSGPQTGCESKLQYR